MEGLYLWNVKWFPWAIKQIWEEETTQFIINSEKVIGPLCFQVMNIHEFFCPCHYKYKIFVKKVAYGEESSLWKFVLKVPDGMI